MEQYVEVKRTKKAPAFPDLRNRVIKTLSVKSFDAIPEWFGELDVQRLILSKCKLAALPASLATMTSLRAISFVDCELPALPVQAFAPPALEELSVFFDRNTLLTDYPRIELPDPLPGSKTLTSLSIHGYVVPVIPDSIAGFPALAELVVIPLVREVPSTLPALRALRRLDLLHSHLVDFRATLALIAQVPLEELTISNIVVDQDTEAAWRRLGTSVRKLLARSFAMVAPGARGKGGPEAKSVFDLALLQTWMPNAEIRT